MKIFRCSSSHSLQQTKQQDIHMHSFTLTRILTELESIHHMVPLLSKTNPYALLPLQISDSALERVKKHVHVSEVDRFTIFNPEFLDDDDAIAYKQIKEDHWRESTKTLVKSRKGMKPLYKALTQLESVLNLGEPYEINNLVALYSKKGCPQQKMHTDEGDGYQGLKFVSGVVALEEGTSLVIGRTTRREQFSMSIPRGSVRF